MSDVLNGNYIFTGTDGSMGLERGKEYLIINIPDSRYRVFVLIGSIGAKRSVHCGYDSREAFFSNWKIAEST